MNQTNKEESRYPELYQKMERDIELLRDEIQKHEQVIAELAKEKELVQRLIVPFREIYGPQDEPESPKPRPESDREQPMQRFG